uniref:acrosomal protein KIAA1210 homolog n=1 Tax=Jaculus jaculus TaxID=51337 RepID=UPI001E1B25CC|nr:acrosomal protein KIAA1210 homolog [Jaculus jaculus]
MGAKAVSHDSIFILGSEFERSSSKLHLTMDSQRGRPLQISASRTLPRALVPDVQAALSAAMGEAVGPSKSRSGVQIAGSKITELPSLRSCKPSISPPVIRSERTSVDSGNTSVDDKALQSPPKKSLIHRASMSKKSISESSSGPDQSQPSPRSSHQLSSLEASVATDSCLDTSAARHKIALNPRKQKKKKSLPTIVKPKQEEMSLLQISREEKTETKLKESDKKEQIKDSTECSSQEHRNIGETHDKKTTEQAPSTDALMIVSYSLPSGNARKRRRRGRSEFEIKERSHIQSSPGYDQGNKSESSPTNKTARECLSLKFTTPQACTAPQELLSDKGIMKRSAGIDFEVKRASAAKLKPGEVVTSVVTDPPSLNEEEASGAKKKEDKTFLLPWIRRFSTTQAKTIVTGAEEAQVPVHPSHSQAEDEVSSLGLQNVQHKKEVTMDTSTILREKPLRNVGQAIPASVTGMTSTTAEANVSAKRLPHRGQSQGQPEAVVSSDSRSASEDERSSEDQLVPVYLPKSKWRSKNYQEGTHRSESLDMGLSSSDQQLSPASSSQFLGRSDAEEASSDSELSSEEHKSSEEMTSDHVSQSLEELEEFSKSQSLIMGSTSEEQLASRSHVQDSQDSEEKEVSTESSSYIEKYNSSEDFSTTEEDQPVEQPHEVLGQPKDKDTPSVSKSISKEQSICVKQMSPIQQQTSSSVTIPTKQNQYEGPVSPGHSAKSWMSSEYEHQVSVSPESFATEWDVCMQPLPPRKAYKHQKRYKVEQKVSSSPEIEILEEVVSMEALPPRCHSQQEVSSSSEHAAEVNTVMMPPRRSSVRPKVKKEVCLDIANAEVGGHVSMEPLSPKHHSQLSVKPQLQKHVSSEPRIPTCKGSISVDLRPSQHHFQSGVKPQVQQQVSSLPESTDVEGVTSKESQPSKCLSKSRKKSKAYQNVPSKTECVAIEKFTSVEPLHSKHFSQPLPNPQGKEIFPENTSIEGGTLMEPLPPQPTVNIKFQPQMTQDPVSISTQQSCHVEQMHAKHNFSPEVDPKFKQQVCESSDSDGAEVSIPVQSMSPRSTSQPQLTLPFEQIYASSEHFPATWCIPEEPSLSRIHCQPKKESVSKQAISTGSESTSEQGSSSEDLFQSLVDPSVKEQLPAGQQSYALEGDTLVKQKPHRCHSQPPMRSGLKKEVSGPKRASAEWNDHMEPVPPKYTSQLWINPESEPQVSSSQESDAMEKSIFKDVRPFRNPSRIIIKQRVQKITTSSFEGSTSAKPLPLKCPTPSAKRSKVQEMSSRLENATAEEDINNKEKHSKAPSQSFVKFMTQRVFTENLAIERATHVNSMTPRRTSRALLKPKLEDIKYDWSTYLEGDISLKKLPMKQSSQSSCKPKDPQQVRSRSESVAVRLRRSKSQPPAGQLYQAKGKLEYVQEITSVSVSCPKNMKNSGERLPSQESNVSTLQPPILSTGSVSIPIECGDAEGHLLPSQPYQDFGNTKYQRIYSSSIIASSEESTYEKNTGSKSLPKGQPLPKRTKKYSCVSGEFSESTPTSVSNLCKFTAAPAQKPPISEDIYSKEKFLQSGDSSSSSSASKVDVENVFGVRLRKVSPQKYKSEKRYKTKKPEQLTQPSPLPSIPVSYSVAKKEGYMQKSASLEFQGTSEKVNPKHRFAVKQRSRHRHEDMAKIQPPYKLPGKSSGQQSDRAHSEPSWVTMAKQKQKNFVACDPVNEPQTKSICESKAETQELKYEGAVTAAETPLRRYLSSTHLKQDKKAKMNLSKSSKSVAFEEQRMVRSATRERETKRSKSLPPKLQKVEEPVWFSMAKKKAKAWSHIADIM